MLDVLPGCAGGMDWVRALVTTLLRYRSCIYVSLMWFFVGDGVVNLVVNLAWVVRHAWFLPLGDCVVSSAINNVTKRVVQNYRYTIN